MGIQVLVRDHNNEENIRRLKKVMNTAKRRIATEHDESSGVGELGNEEDTS